MTSVEIEESLVLAEAAVADARARPEQFADVPAWASHTGISEERLAEFIRIHYHATPEAVLRRARLEVAKTRLLTTKETPGVIARSVGYRGSRAFETEFHVLNGLTPLAYRELRDARSFKVALPKAYPLQHLRHALGRDRHSVVERLEGDTYVAGIRVGAEPKVLTLQLGREAVVASIDRPTPHMARIHEIVVGLLGLGQEAAELRRLARRLDLGRLVQGRSGLRYSLTHSVYSGLLLTIIGQQINLPFAFQLQRRLVEKVGEPVGGGLYAPPEPQAVAGLEPEALLPLQFSRQKASYLISISRQVAEGALDLEALPQLSATRAERTLLSLRGLGPWSVNYLMMRALGFADCLPLGDTGVTSGLRVLFNLQERPDAKETLRLMAPFSPYRSLATAHLWKMKPSATPAKAAR